MRCILIVLLFACAAVASASEMWRWTDERGVVHYSDRPHPGAERVDVKPAQSYEAPPVVPRTPGASPQTSPLSAPALSYSQLSILAPAAGETLWNIGGQLNVQLLVEPAIADGHALQLYLDGSPVADVPTRQTQFTIGEVWRGEHNLRASIVDDAGREVASSGTIVFYVQQTSLQNPQRRQGPGAGAGGG